jgi:hypothetical protein
VTRYVPVQKLGVLLPPQNQFQDKFGGLPWGLPRARWPRCGHCRAPLSFLSQLIHDPERLDLGRPGRHLLAFQCDAENKCPEYEGGSGANAVVLLEPEEVEPRLTAPPHPEMTIHTETRVLRWKACKRLGNTEKTLLGGEPHWFQNEEPPPPPYRFVLQMQFSYEFTGKIPAADDLGCEVHREVRGRTVVEYPKAPKVGAPFCAYVFEKGWGVQTFIFADSLIYVFLRTDTHPPQGWMLSQAT